MAGETTLTIVGNLTDDPELRFTQSGAAVVNFTIASTPRRFDKSTNTWEDGDPLFMRCSAWRTLAENIAESLSKGHRVIATGNIRQRSYETREGEKRTVVEMEVTDLGHSLMWVTSKISRNDKPRPARQEPDPWANGKQAADPWASPAATDDPPF